MDAFSATVVTSSIILAYLNSNSKPKETFISEPSIAESSLVPEPSKSVEREAAAISGIDPVVARSEDFLKLRLSTMLSEGTLSDVKAVCRQIEDAGLEQKIKDYARAQNIIASTPNECNQPQQVSVPTRYQNKPLAEFVHNNFVPFFSGRHTQNMVGTGVSSGNWTSNNDATTITQMEYHTGADPYVKPSRSKRNPESTVFKPGEFTADNTVWGTPLKRPELDRYVDITNSRPDLKPTESIQIGPGLEVDPSQNVGSRGFHELYQPREDALNKINGTMKLASVQAEPRQGYGLGMGTAYSTYSPGIMGSLDISKESFSQDNSQDKKQGKSFIVKKCNEEIDKERHQFATRGVGGTAYTGEHNTEQLLRGETQRGQATKNVLDHFPGLKTGEVKRHTEQYGEENPQINNIKLYKTGIDRELHTREGLPTGAMGNQMISGHDSGPGRFYLNDTFTNNDQFPVMNVTRTAGQFGAKKLAERVDQQASTTNRQFQTSSHTELMQYGARANSGHQSSIGDADTKTHRASANSDNINHGALHVSKIQKFNMEEGERSNLRAGTLVGHRPQMAHSNVVAPVKIRVGGYKLNDLRSETETADRPHANSAKYQNEYKQGDSTVKDNKFVENYSDPRTGMNLAKGYGKIPTDSKTQCNPDILKSV